MKSVRERSENDAGFKEGQGSQDGGKQGMQLASEKSRVKILSKPCRRRPVTSTTWSSLSDTHFGFLIPEL